MTASQENQRKISQSSSDQLIYNTALDEDLQGKCGVIVYDDLKNPHLVETQPDDIIDHYSSPVLFTSVPCENSPMSERSSGLEYDPYSSIRSRGVGDDGDTDSDKQQLYQSVEEHSDNDDECDQVYEAVNPIENEVSVSSETSDGSQTTVLQANMADLYAKVDRDKKKNRNSVLSPVGVIEGEGEEKFRVPVPTPQKVRDQGRSKEIEIEDKIIDRNKEDVGHS